MRTFGLIGFPLSHSFSPPYFTKKFLENGIDASYKAYPIEKIEALTELLRSNPGLEGLNVTIPYKKAVIPYLDFRADAVIKTGACNCIKIKNGKLFGYNTDVIGFQQSLMPLLSNHHSSALILGTGGAASAVAYVLEQLDIRFKYVSRTAQSPNCLKYDDLTESLLDTHTLIINTTPLGMYPLTEETPSIPYQWVNNKHYLFDLIYNPEETLFLKKGKANGAVVKNGADMLYIQADESWRIWNDDKL